MMSKITRNSENTDMNHPAPATLESIQPVSGTATETRGPRPGSALCLSGGGYRAMLFHLGTLWRLNQLGFLRKLARVSSVSGGSITAGVLGLAYEHYRIGKRCHAFEST